MKECLVVQIGPLNVSHGWKTIWGAMSFDVSCSHLLLPICLVTCQGDEVYRPLLGTAKGFQQGDAQGVSNLGFCFNFLLVVSKLGFKIQINTLRLWIQGDNTPKELRNSYTGKWACLLTQGKYFKSVAHHHMVVGHTHEDIGKGQRKKQCWNLEFKFFSFCFDAFWISCNEHQRVKLTLPRWCVLLGHCSTSSREGFGKPSWYPSVTCFYSKGSFYSHHVYHISPKFNHWII